MHQPTDIPTKVKFVRLNTGEDLVTEIAFIKEGEAGNYYVFMNPLKIIYSLNQKPGYLSVSLMQWIFPKICDKQEFVIYPNDVMTIAPPSDNMLTYYYASLERMNEVQFHYGEDDGEYDEDEIPSEDISEEDLNYVNKLIDEIKNNKKRLH
jgi:hypothetical protein